MSGDILPFPAKPVSPKTPDERSVDSLIRQLNEAHARGEVKSLVWTYSDGESGGFNGVSGNMDVRDFAFHVAILQERLMRWIDNS